MLLQTSPDEIIEIFHQSNPTTLTDGAELTLFVWREFCESNNPPTTEGISIEQVIISLRSFFQTLAY